MLRQSYELIIYLLGLAHVEPKSINMIELLAYLLKNVYVWSPHMESKHLNLAVPVLIDLLLGEFINSSVRHILPPEKRHQFILLGEKPFAA